MIRGMIFDADGTLLDTMPAWTGLGRRYLASVGIEAEEELDPVLLSMSLEEGGRYLKETYALPDPPEKIAADAVKLLEDFYRLEAAPKKGAVDFLGRMRRRNMPMAIATSGDGERLRTALDRLGMTGFFSAILTCSELKTSKHEPGIYHRAAELMGTAPEETAVFEDALHAIETAKRAGFMVFAVEDAASVSQRETIRKTADHWLRDFTDPALLEL